MLLLVCSCKTSERAVNHMDNKSYMNTQRKGENVMKDRPQRKNEENISIKYIKKIISLPDLILPDEWLFPKGKERHLNWDLVAKEMIEENKSSKTLDELKKELVQKYDKDGLPFKFVIFFNRPFVCGKCEEILGGDSTYYVVSIKNDIFMTIPYEKIHNIQTHQDSFSEEELETLNKIIKNLTSQ